MLESLRRQVASLEAEVKELEERVKAKVKEKTSSVARLQARLFMEKIFLPYVEGLCNGLDLSPEDGVEALIRDGKTLDSLADENREALAELLRQPECRVIIAVAGPVAKMQEEWIKEMTAVLLETMEDVRPALARTIKETPGGPEWFAESLIGLRNILFGRPKK